MIGFKKKDDKNDRKLILLSDKASFAYQESYKALKTNIDFLLKQRESFEETNDEKKRGALLMVTSSIPREGKSNVSVNLAISFAKGGKNVILIDCDLRKGMLQTYLNWGDKAKGVSRILESGWTCKQVVGKTTLGFDFLPAGPTTTNAAMILESDVFNVMLTKLAERYDYVICDTPPVNAVTDAAIVAQHVDGVVLVVSQNYVSKENVIAAKKQLDNINANILGVILNMYDVKNNGLDNHYNNYYYSYHKYDTYGYSYGTNKE